MARTPRVDETVQVVELMYAQQEASDRSTNSLIDFVMAAALLAVNEERKDHGTILPTEVTINPESFKDIVNTYEIERVFHDDGSRTIRLYPKPLEARS